MKRAIRRRVQRDARGTAGVLAVTAGLGCLSISGLIMSELPAAAAFTGTNGDVGFVTTRNNNVNILQVNPTGSGVGTSAGDLANTTPLTNGSVDAEPFYSPDGTQVVFSSNRNGKWAIFS